MPEFKGVSHVELTVRDAERSAAWYERVLGMQRLAVPTEHVTIAGTINMLHPGASLSLNLVPHSIGDAEFSEFHVGLDHLAFAVESRDELEKWARHLEDCGVVQSPISDAPYESVLVFRDPDNIQLEFMVYNNVYG